MVKISIIIVNYNAGNYLRNCLYSVYTALSNINESEVWVVDNNSTDDSIRLIKGCFPGVKLIKNDKNYGFARANNQAIKLSTGKYILLLNPDTTVDSTALTSMIEFMDTHIHVGICGCKILNSDKTIQYSCRSFPSYTTALFSRGSLLTRYFPNNRFSRRYKLSDWDHSQPREVDWVSGACLMIRRRTLDEIGLLDENFHMYIEDIDWCLRARKSGWKVVYYPNAVITHFNNQLHGTYNNRLINLLHKSTYYFYRKHYPQHVVISWLVFLAIVFRSYVLTIINSVFSNPKTKKIS